MGNILTPVLTLTVLVLALIGGGLIIAGLVRMLRGRLLRGMSLECFGAALLGLATLVGAIFINLYTYDRLTREQTLADLSFQRVGEHTYRAQFTESGGRQRTFVLQGDQWQLDARVIKWQGVATMAGLDPLYRLERLSGRYIDVRRERNAPRTVYALGPQAGVDVWDLAQRYQSWLPWIDATYGSGVYVPLADGARYRVQLGTSGLLARPLNQEAKGAVAEWR